MITKDVIEAMAKAHKIVFDTYAPLDASTVEDCRRVAMTAALTALRNMGPSEAMVVAGRRAGCVDDLDLAASEVEAIFRAMLDAALQTKAPAGDQE